MPNNNPTPDQPDLPPDDLIIQGHNYDGIKEYDNPMPGWWTAIFWVSVIFAPIYIVGLHYLDVFNTYEEDLAESMAELQETKTAFAAQNPATSLTDESLSALVDDANQVAAGEALFATYCLACHGDAGQGLIGPNLTDDYWIRDPNPTTILDVINQGVLDKGMPGWEAVLDIEQRSQIVAFVLTLRGTDPPNPKAPEGTLISL